MPKLKQTIKVLGLITLVVGAVALQITTTNPTADALADSATVCNDWKGDVVCYRP